MDLSQTPLKSMMDWERILWCTGGAFEFNKSFCCLGVWAYDLSGPYLQTKEDLGITEGLTIIDSSTGEVKQIKIHDPDHAEKYLGVFIRLDGEMTDQKEALIQITKKFAGLYQSKKMIPHHARTLFERILMPKLTYCLAATRFTKDECKEIMDYVMPIATARMGYLRTSAAAVLYGPPKFGGVGLPDLYTEQGIQAVTELLGHIRTFSDLSPHIRVLLSQAQLWAGISRPILEDCETCLPHLPQSWIKHLRSFLHEIDGSVLCTFAWQPPSQNRDGDSTLMDVMIERALTPTEITHFNYCRLYARAINVSDLLTVRGDEFDKDILYGRRQNPSKLSWPHIEKPPEQMWRTFTKHCLRAYSPQLVRSGRRPKKLLLQNPLGRWHQCRHHRLYRYWLNESTNRLYEIDHDNRTVHTYLHLPDRGEYVRTTHSVQKLPREAIPVEIFATNTVRIIGHIHSRPPPHKRLETPTMTLQERINCQPEPIRRIIGNVDIPDDEYRELATHLAKGKAILVSDGSVKNQEGGHEWRLACETLDRSTDAHAAGPCDGNPATINSYRAELSGMLGGICFVTILLRHHQLSLAPETKLIAFCDNKAALDAPTPIPAWSNGIKRGLAPENDLIMEIQTLLDDNNITVETRHVKGHQDQDADVNDLPFPVQCNIWCDEGAGQFLDDPPGDYIPDASAPAMPNNPVTFRLNGVTVTSDVPTLIREHYLGTKLRNFTVKKQQKLDPSWSDDVYDLIDWDSRDTANKRESPAVQRRAVKFANRWLPIGNHNFSAKTDAGKQCPSCSSLETHTHLFQCQSSLSRSNFQLQLVYLHQFLRPTKILPIVWTTIKSELLYAAGHGPQPTHSFPHDSTGEWLQQAVLEQTQIGWLNMFNGWLSSKWGLAMQAYYSIRFRDKRSLSAKSFQVRLVRGLRRFFEGIWQQRNSILNDSENSKKTHDINKQIQELYRRRNHLVAPTDIPLFRALTADQCQALPLQSKQAWIKSVHTAIIAHHGSLKPITARIARIDDYFHRQQRIQQMNTSEEPNRQEG